MQTGSQHSAVAAASPIARTFDAAPASENSYGQILKSSAMIGASTVLTLVVGLLRVKVMALLLGPAGIGLIGLYGAVVDVARSIATMGVGGSGVRQIALAVGSGDTRRIALTAVVLRRTSIALGVIGAIVLAIVAVPVSTLTFGDASHASGIALLSLAVLFGCVSAGQGALIQGVRHIGDLAKMGVAGALLGTVVAVPIVYIFREDGVVPSMVGITAAALLTSWWYSRKVGVERPPVTALETGHEAVQLLRLGFAFMASAVLVTGAAYAVRAILLRDLGLEAAGLYQAAWTLAGLYVAFVLQAMGADFYPRLVAASADHAACNRLVNEQAQVSLLLAVPGAIGTIAFAQPILSILYSSQFNEASDVLRWICLGMALRVFTWPMGFIIVAKGRQALFFGTEAAWAIVGVGLAWFCVRSYGLSGAGIAFFGSYLFHALMIYPIVWRLSGFRWSAANIKLGGLCLALIAAAFCAFHTLPPLLALAGAALITVLSAVCSAYAALRLVPIDRIPTALLRVLRFNARLRGMVEPSVGADCVQPGGASR